jgi:hypothetical protein
MKKTALFILMIFQLNKEHTIVAQSYLPQFSVIKLSNRNNKISWNNPHKNCIQLAVQRSTDSVNNFRTILSAQSPELAENGFIDKTAPEQGSVYYRIFYTLKGGAYYFSKTIAPSKENNTIESKKTLSKKSSKKKKGAKNKKTKNESTDKRTINSKYVRITDKGDLQINIPKALEIKYDIFIYNEDKKTMFSIDAIHETSLTIEKVNFIKAGWFEYELIEAGKVIERKRFYIQKN